MEVTRERLDLTEVIQLALEQSRPLALKSGIELVFRPIDDMLVIGDRQRLLQVFLNLVSNALKFTPTGGRVEIEAMQSTSMLTIQVVDTGIGIAEDQLESIFDEFAQAALTEAAAPSGTGLGLPLTRRLLQLMKGTVVAHSSKDAGSTFVVTIPRAMTDIHDEVRVAGG